MAVHFNNAIGLTSITIPSSVTSIGNSAFYDCRSLTSISIPSGVTAIEDSTFEECSSLTSISIPSSVTSIKYSAFYKCTNAKFYIGNEILRTLLIRDCSIANIRITLKA